MSYGVHIQRLAGGDFDRVGRIDGYLAGGAVGRVDEVVGPQLVLPAHAQVVAAEHLAARAALQLREQGRLQAAEPVPEEGDVVGVGGPDVVHFQRGVGGHVYVPQGAQVQVPAGGVDHVGDDAVSPERVGLHVLESAYAVHGQAAGRARRRDERVGQIKVHAAPAGRHDLAQRQRGVVGDDHAGGRQRDLLAARVVAQGVDLELLLPGGQHQARGGDGLAAVEVVHDNLAPGPGQGLDDERRRRARDAARAQVIYGYAPSGGGDGVHDEGFARGDLHGGGRVQVDDPELGVVRVGDVICLQLLLGGHVDVLGEVDLARGRALDVVDLQHLAGCADDVAGRVQK